MTILIESLLLSMASLLDNESLLAYHTKNEGFINQTQ